MTHMAPSPFCRLPTLYTCLVSSYSQKSSSGHRVRSGGDATQLRGVQAVCPARHRVRTRARNTIKTRVQQAAAFRFLLLSLPGLSHCPCAAGPGLRCAPVERGQLALADHAAAVHDTTERYVFGLGAPYDNLRFTRLSGVDHVLHGVLSPLFERF